MTNKREYFVSEPQNVADASVIWLHGLGADGKDFMGLVDQLGLPPNHGVRFIFPSAPFIQVTVNHGLLMRAWYDIYDFDMLRKEDEVGVGKSQQIIDEYIQHEVSLGIAHNRIIIAGFSQGGAMTLYTALRYEQPLGGAISLSAYMPLAPTFDGKKNLANKNLPIYLAHGVFDPVVPFNFGQEARDLLTRHNYPVEWHSYPIPHTVCIEEIETIGAFIRRCLGYA